MPTWKHLRDSYLSKSFIAPIGHQGACRQTDFHSFIYLFKSFHISWPESSPSTPFTVTLEDIIHPSYSLCAFEYLCHLKPIQVSKVSSNIEYQWEADFSLSFFKPDLMTSEGNQWCIATRCPIPFSFGMAREIHSFIFHWPFLTCAASLLILLIAGNYNLHLHPANRCQLTIYPVLQC